MGFQVGRVFRLEGEFKDTGAEGAYVTIRSTSVGEIIASASYPRVKDAEWMAAHIVEWNLENEAGPIPVTADGVMSLEEPLMDLIYTEWLKATRGLTAPFDRRSAGGEQSPVEDSPAPSIPMEDL